MKSSVTWNINMISWLKLSQKFPDGKKKRWKMKISFSFFRQYHCCILILPILASLKSRIVTCIPSVWQINFHILVTDIIYYLIYFFRDMETHKWLQSTKCSILKVIKWYVKQLGNFLHKHLSIKNSLGHMQFVGFYWIACVWGRRSETLCFAASITTHFCVVKYAFVLSDYVFQTAV